MGHGNIHGISVHSLRRVAINKFFWDQRENRHEGYEWNEGSTSRKDAKNQPKW